jgi:hypothetical protein
VIYRPLCSTPAGRRVKSDPPYADGSCRREPDLESKFPSITALCRGRNFAPRLHVGDRVAYVSSAQAGTWRLTALLEVVKRFETHEEAATWYRGQGLPPPSNCMVRGTSPLPLRRTHGVSHCGELKKWDEHYQQRANECGVFLACKPLWRNLQDPPMITRKDWEQWGGAPTRTPSNTPNLWEPLWGLRLTSDP